VQGLVHGIVKYPHHDDIVAGEPKVYEMAHLAHPEPAWLDEIDRARANPPQIFVADRGVELGEV
jgi:hypothetical protein